MNKILISSLDALETDIHTLQNTQRYTIAEKKLIARILSKELSDHLDDMRYTYSEEEFEYGCILLSTLIDYGGSC